MPHQNTGGSPRQRPPAPVRKRPKRLWLAAQMNIVPGPLSLTLLTLTVASPATRKELGVDSTTLVLAAFLATAAVRIRRMRAARGSCPATTRGCASTRFASYSGQYYTETIFHVGFGERWPENRFVDARPGHGVDWMADLF